MASNRASHPAEESLATRASLLGRLKNWDDAESWEDFTRTYSQLIRNVARKSGLTDAEAKDVEQETLLSVAKSIHAFESSPQRGSFKNWLLTLTRWRIVDQLRRRSPAAAGLEGTRTGTATAERIPDPATGCLEEAWDVEWKQNILETALARVSRRTKAKHLQVFDLYARRQWPAAKVAARLGVPRAQVYIICFRLTRQLKREAERLSKALGE